MIILFAQTYFPLPSFFSLSIDAHVIEPLPAVTATVEALTVESVHIEFVGVNPVFVKLWASESIIEASLPLLPTKLAELIYAVWLATSHTITCSAAMVYN